MPSLKDLRNRIASVKATQKITKAMQMVATARLRRAQQVAEAARPYAERMEKVLANLAASISPGAPAPALLGGTGRDQTHLLVVCTGERGLSGAFNGAIVRLAREHAVTLMGQGKTVKFFCVGKKGYDLLRRQFERQIIERTDLRGVRNIGFDNANEIGRRIIALLRCRGVRRLHALLLALQIDRRADSDGAAADPGASRGLDGHARGGPRLLRLRAGRGGHPHRAAAAQHLGAGVPRAAREHGVVLRRADERDGQRDTQCRRDDQQADDAL